MVVHGMKLSDDLQSHAVAIAVFSDPYTSMAHQRHCRHVLYKNCKSGDLVCGGGANFMAYLGYDPDIPTAAKFIADRMA
jgi:hypothetical protein